MSQTQIKIEKNKILRDIGKTNKVKLKQIKEIKTWMGESMMEDLNKKFEDKNKPPKVNIIKRIFSNLLKFFKK